MKPFVRKTLTRSIAFALAWSLQLTGMPSQAGDLTNEMQKMFDQAGVMGNTTGPGAYRGQTMSIYTGGEMQMRAPIRSYQIWSVAMPSVRAGCGGIDAYLGSFSHISSAQFKAMLQQIGANTVGLLFKAALKSINPMIESVLGDLEKTITQYNQFSMNSCQMAQSLVNGMSGASGITADSSCQSMAMSFFGDDAAAAQVRCKSPTEGPASVNSRVKGSQNPDQAALAARDINLVWDALKKSPYTKEEKEMFMNIAGTILLYKAANNGNVPRRSEYRDPSVDSLNTLLFGNKPGPTDDSVRIAGWWTCPDDDCMAPTNSEAAITPFTTLVRQRLELLRDQIANHTPLTANMVAFINMTNVPVYRMMSVGYHSDSSAKSAYLSDVLINRYAKVIAYDYAYAFLSRALKDVRVYVGLANLQTSDEEKQAAELRQRVDAMLAALDRERSEASARVRNAGAVVDDIQRIEREMRTGLPNAIRNMLDFSNLLTGRGTRM